jgi:cytochrome c peroxidase
MGRASFALAFVGIVACADSASQPTALHVFPTPFSPDEAPGTADTLLAPLPTHVKLDPRKVALGKRLYFDKRLSGDGKVACNDCHDLGKGGANGLPRSKLPGRGPVPVNVPTIFNAAYNFRFAWSGRFADLGEQLDAAMTLPPAMASSWDGAVERLAKDPSYVREFADVYPEGLTDESLREAVGIYSLSLSTPNSRFDRHLRGELELTPAEQNGYEMFRDYGCVSCHQGINVGGNMHQRFGVMQDYFAGRDDLTPADNGLFVETGREEDRFVFRVPSLRNVALTAPYFHDGSADTLEDAIRTMSLYQLGRQLSRDQIFDIAAFLRTLTGELEGKPL